jgi:hypothetical protein
MVTIIRISLEVLWPIERYGNKLNLVKEFQISNGFFIRISITIKKCGATLRKKLSIISSLMNNYPPRIL